MKMLIALFSLLKHWCSLYSALKLEISQTLSVFLLLSQSLTSISSLPSVLFVWFACVMPLHLKSFSSHEALDLHALILLQLVLLRSQESSVSVLPAYFHYFLYILSILLLFLRLLDLITNEINPVSQTIN